MLCRYVALTALMTATTVYAQAPRAPAAPQLPNAQGGGAPKIKLSQMAWNFGEIWDSDRPQLSLTVSNEGQGNLELKDVKAACSCTVLEVPRKVLAPGQSMAIPVRYDPSGKQGDQKTYVTITSNDPTAPSVEIPITGKVKRAVLMQPYGGLFLRTLDTAAGQVFTAVRLTNQLPEPMTLQLTSNTAPWVTVELQEITPKLEYLLGARTIRELKPGRVHGALTFATGLSREQAYRVPVTIDVLEMLHPEPRGVLASSTLAGREYRIRLMYFGQNEQIKITGVECVPPGLDVKPPVLHRPEPDWAVFKPAIRLTAEAPFVVPDPRAIPAKGYLVRFSTNDPNCPTAEVLVTADRNAWEVRTNGPAEGQAP